MVAQQTYRLNRDRIATLKSAYDAIGIVPEEGHDRTDALVDFAREMLLSDGVENFPPKHVVNLVRFNKTLRELALESRGDVIPTLENLEALQEGLLSQIENALRDMPQVKPRQMPGADPKASVNNFMVSLAVLDPVFDLCARLDAKQTPPDGSNEVYYASRSAYGLKFTSSEEAENARDTFRKILKDGKDISINPRMVNHREEYWVEVPSDLATKIISETAALAKMRQDVAAQFEAGDKAEARENRRALYDIIDEMGFADGHVAAEMAREAIAPRVRAR